VNLDTQQLRDLVQRVAQEELLPRFAQVRAGTKADGSLVTAADTQTQQRLRIALHDLYPDIGFLGEEMTRAEQEAQFASDAPLWCLDPLDGTSNFVAGIPYFSVSLALLHQGQALFALVYDPVRDECFSATAEGKALLNGQVLQAAETNLQLKQCIALIDFKRLSPTLATRLVTEIPYASQRSFGSVALDWCWLAAQRVHLYLHGSSHLWDYAAGQLICSAAGAHCCTLDGEPLMINRLEKRSSVGAADAQLFADWCEWLGVPR